MLRFAADENLDIRIVQGLRGQAPEIDVVSVQDARLRGATDPMVLEWAAAEDRLVLTHDVSTMTAFAWQRVRRGERMPGVVQIPASLPIGHAVDDLVILALGSRPGEWEGQVVFLPL